MIDSPHKSRLVGALAVVAAVAATVAPAAQSGSKPDAVDRHLRNNTPVYLDAVDRAVANATYASPDAVDRYLANNPGTQAVDLRSPDTRAAASGRVAAGSRAVAASASTAFDWGDAGIGAGASFGLMLLLLGMRQIVQRRSTPVTGLSSLSS